MTKLIGFGASSMQGACDSRGGFFKRLEQKLTQAGKAYECHNFGIGGNTTRDMVARLDTLRPHLPCRAIILLGCNDMTRKDDGRPQIRTSLDEYSANLETIFDTFDGPQTIFVTSFMVNPWCGIAPETFTEYMSVALKKAASHKMVMWDLFKESLTFEGKFWAEDGGHFNDAGHEYIAEHLLPMVLKGN